MHERLVDPAQRLLHTHDAVPFLQATSAKLVVKLLTTGRAAGRLLERPPAVGGATGSGAVMSVLKEQQ